MPDPRRNYSSPDDVIGGFTTPEGAVSVGPAPAVPAASVQPVQLRGQTVPVPRNAPAEFWRGMASEPRIMGDGSMRFNVGTSEYSIPASDRAAQQAAITIARQRFPQQSMAEGMQGQPQEAAPGQNQLAQPSAAQPGPDMSGLLNAVPQQVRRPGVPGGGAMGSYVQETRAARDAAMGELDQLEDPSKTLAEREQRMQGARDTANAQVNQQSTALNEQGMAEEQARQDDLRRRAQAIDAEIDRVSNMRVDPNNWFASRGTVGAIGAALAVGLGAAAQSLQGGQNNALGIINAAIDRDMQAQEQNLRAAGQRVGERQNALQQLRAQYGDERAAREAYRMRSLQIAERMAEQAVQRAATPTAREIAAQQLAEIQGQSMLSRQNFQQSLALKQQEAYDQARRGQVAAASRRSGGTRRPDNDLEFRVAASRAIAARMPNASPEQVATAVNNIMTARSAGTLGSTPDQLAILQDMSNSQGRPAQAVDNEAALRSQVNAQVAAGTAGFGRVAGAIRGMEPGFTRDIARTAANAVGIQTELSPEVAAELTQYNARRTELIGSAQSEQERADIAAQLPNLGTGWRSAEETARLLPVARAASDTIARQQADRVRRETEARSSARAQPQQSVLSSGRGRR